MEEKNTPVNPTTTNNSQGELASSIVLPKEVASTSEPKQISENPLPQNGSNFENVFGQSLEVPTEPEKPSEPEQPAETPQPMVNEPPVVREKPMDVSPKTEEMASPKIEGQDQVIAEIKPEKEVSPIFLIFIFAALILFAFFLPTIQEKLTAYQNSKIPVTKNPETPSTTIPPVDEVTVEKVALNANTTIEYSNVLLDNFTFTTDRNSHYLSYHLTNTDITKEIPTNLYLELYNSENTLLARAKVYVNNNQKKGDILNLSSIISSVAANESTQVSLVAKSDVDMPYKELNDDTTGNQVLTCHNDINHIITYTFAEYYLIRINDEYSETLSESSPYYNDNLNDARNLNAVLRQYKGIDSNITISSSNYTLVNEFDLINMDDISNLNNPVYFNKGTLARRVEFDMQALNYVCS